MIKRIHIQKDDQHLLELFIHPRKQASDFSYPIVLLVIWIMGVFLIAGEFTGAEMAGNFVFISVMALLWLICGSFLAYLFLWKLLGKEVIIANPKGVHVGKEIAGIRQLQFFPREKILQVSRTGRDKATRQSMSVNYFGIMGGEISLHTENAPRLFGLQLSQKDADRLIEKIAPFLGSSK